MPLSLKPADAIFDSFPHLLKNETIRQAVERIVDIEKLKLDRNQPQQHIDQQLKHVVVRAFTAYCRYLSAKRWHYQPQGGFVGAVHAGRPTPKAPPNWYSIFLYPDNPTANCRDAAVGFLLLLEYLGVPRGRMQLMILTAGGEDNAIFMRGLRLSVKKAYASYPHQFECGYEIRPQGDQLTSAPMYQMVMDTPFDNHFFVKCDNMYWDPTYGFAFSTPDAVFCSCQSWLLEDHGFVLPGVDSFKNEDGIFYAKSVGYWVVNVNTPERQWYLNQVVPGLNIVPKDGPVFLYFKDTTSKEAMKARQADRSSLLLVPPALAQSIFSIAGFLKPRLMKAVLAYEKNTGFLRSPSLETKTALAQIRRYAGDSTFADASVQKKLYRQKDVQGRIGMHIWTDREALNFARRARQPGNDLVGKRLQQTLAKAFEGYDYCFNAQ
jgi:hypothetical protein